MEISHRIEGQKIIGLLEISHYEAAYDFPVSMSIRNYVIDVLKTNNYEVISGCKIMQLAELSPNVRFGFELMFVEKTQEKIDYENIQSFIDRLE